MLGRRFGFFLQATDFLDQFFFVGSGRSGNSGGGQRGVQPFFQRLGFQGLCHPGFSARMRCHHVHTTKRGTVCLSDPSDRGKVHGGVSGFLLQPIFVSAGQGKIRPVKELAFLLGTTQVHPIGILVRTTLIQGGRFATETQQMFPHPEKV